MGASSLSAPFPDAAMFGALTSDTVVVAEASEGDEVPLPIGAGALQAPSKAIALNRTSFLLLIQTPLTRDANWPKTLRAINLPGPAQCSRNRRSRIRAHRSSPSNSKSQVQ